MPIGSTASLTKLTSWSPLAVQDVDVSLVIACYCETGHLLRNIRKLAHYILATRFRYEIIFVDDASPDGTMAEIMAATQLLTELGIAHTVLAHSQNVGRGGTVQDGMKEAKGNIVGFLDIDLENPLDSLLPILLRLEQDEADVIVAQRMTYSSTALRKLASRTYRTLLGLLLPLPVKDTEAGFKFFKRQAIMPVLPSLQDRQWFWDTEIVARAAHAGLRVIGHPILFIHDPNKQSTVRIVRDSLRYLVALNRFRRNLGDKASTPMLLKRIGDAAIGRETLAN